MGNQVMGSLTQTIHSHGIRFRQLLKDINSVNRNLWNNSALTFVSFLEALIPYVLRILF